MTGEPSHFQRKSIRLEGYDYAQAGAYFVTVVTHRRVCMFGKVVNGEMVLNAYGHCVRNEWFRTASLRSNIELYEEEMVVMPNHVHGIIWIIDENPGRGAATLRPYTTLHLNTTPHTNARSNNVTPNSLGAIVRAFKSSVTYHINQLRDSPGMRVWQRNYYEHIIRNQNDYEATGKYIISNPDHWTEDEEYNNLIVIPTPLRSLT